MHFPRIVFSAAAAALAFAPVSAKEPPKEAARRTEEKRPVEKSGGVRRLTLEEYLRLQKERIRMERLKEKTTVRVRATPPPRDAKESRKKDPAAFEKAKREILKDGKVTAEELRKEEKAARAALGEYFGAAGDATESSANAEENG